MMAVELNAYLNFRDNAREAMTFYKSVFGGKLDMQTYKQFQASDDPAEDDKIMHAVLDGEHGIKFMAADTPKRMEFPEGSRAFSLSLSGEHEDGELLKGFFEKLSEGGTVPMPMAKAPWDDEFGMCEDKFGVSWLVNIGAKK
jgi:PhnB protein